MSAHDLERIICKRLSSLLGDQPAILNNLGSSSLPARQTATTLETATSHAQLLRCGEPLSRLGLIVKLVERVELGADKVVIRLTAARLADALNLEPATGVDDRPIELSCPATKVWHGRQLRLIVPGPAAADQIRLGDSKLLNLLHEAHAARQLAMAHPDKTIFSLARISGRCRNRLAKFLIISTLAPDIVTAILQGRQPIGFSATRLLEADIPLDWVEQRHVLGFV